MELLASPTVTRPPGEWFWRCACPSSWRLEPQVQIREIAFRSQGVILRGYLMLPVQHSTSRKPPVLVLSHGFSATQHMGLMDTARRICQRTGCAALTFDHGGFGESDGARHHFCIWTQATGYLDAVTYLQQAESAVVDVERIAFWGESLSSRLALVAASCEPLVKAVILVTPPCGRKVEEWVAGGAPATETSAPPTPLSPMTPGAPATKGAGGSIIGGSMGTGADGSFTADGGRSVSSDLSSEDAVAQEAMRAEDAESTFDAMRAQITCMRTKAARVDDHSHGPSGAAMILPVEPTFTIRIIPDEQVGKHVKRHGATKTSNNTEDAPPSGTIRIMSAASDAADSLQATTNDGANGNGNVHGGANGHANGHTNGLLANGHDGLGHEALRASRGASKKRRESTWLKEEQRCRHPAALIQFFNGYSQLVRTPTAHAHAPPFAHTLETARSNGPCHAHLVSQPRAHWSNEIIRVDRTNIAPFFEPAAMTFMRASICMIIAENDEMENCKKEVQYAAFQRAVSACEPKVFVEVRSSPNPPPPPREKTLTDTRAWRVDGLQIPCAMGGHAGMMDAFGIIGHKQTWEGMIDAVSSYLTQVFEMR